VKGRGKGVSVASYVSTSDAAAAAHYWRDREFKKWAVDVRAGPARQPTFHRTIYVRARTNETAIECARHNLGRNPGRCTFTARLAGPAELGCVPTPIKDA
jgi:hypothetical protein